MQTIQNINEANKSLVLYASDEPIPNKIAAGTHERYRFPNLSIEDRKNSNLRPDSVRLRMKYVGICGTDVHLTSADPITGYVKSSAPASIPAEGRIIGHEGVGEIIAIGSDVKHLSVGMSVVPESIISCGLCLPCRRGMFNQCENASLIGMETDGLFAEICDVPSKIAQPIGDLGNSEEGLMSAVLLEPAGVAYLACENAKISPGDKVVIMGAGPIGVLSAIIAKVIFGASHISIIEKSEFRRLFAEQWCDETFNSSEVINASNRFDVMIEASGSLEDAMLLIPHMEPNSRICLLARSGRAININHVDHVISNNMSIIGCRGHLGGIFERLIGLLLSKRLPIRQIITKILPSIEILKSTLEHSEIISTENCKVICKMSSF